MIRCCNRTDSRSPGATTESSGTILTVTCSVFVLASRAATSLSAAAGSDRAQASNMAHAINPFSVQLEVNAFERRVLTIGYPAGQIGADANGFSASPSVDA